MNTSSSTWTFATNGMVIDTTNGERPAKTPTELIVTRAIEAKDGWLGQIVMSGDIVFETEPQTDSDDESGSKAALRIVNQHILDAFRRLIVGG